MSQGPRQPTPDETRPEHPTLPPSEPSEIKRKLFFGMALVLAMASMYAGLLGWGRPIQYSLAVLALIVVGIAVATGATGRQAGGRQK